MEAERWTLETHPGQPKRKPKFEHGQKFLIWNPQGYAVGEVYGPSNEDKVEEFISNARLIAAAPGLLEALTWTLEQLNTLTTDAYSKGGDREIRDRLGAAIDRTRGQG